MNTAGHDGLSETSGLKCGDDLTEFANSDPSHLRNESADSLLSFPFMRHRHELDPFGSCGFGKNQREPTVSGNQTKAQHAKINLGESRFPFRVSMSARTADATLRASDELRKMCNLRIRGIFLTDSGQRVFHRESLGEKGAVGFFDRG